MLWTEPDTTLVGRLRIRSKSPDPHAEKRHIQRLLRAATLSPPGLSASAVLVVRRMTDPLPNRLRASPFATGPDTAWQCAANAKLARALAGAARPAAGSVPAAVNAVLFLDRAELLASLAMDWLEGSVSMHWWWRWVFQSPFDVSRDLFREWQRTPEYVPAAIEILCRRSHAVEFVGAIPPAMAKELLGAIRRAHGISDTYAVDMARRQAEDRPAQDLRREDKPDQEPLHQADGSQQQGDLVPATIDTREIGVVPSSSILNLPWLPWAPEAAATGLAPHARLLIAQCLMLVRAPEHARSSQFQRRLAVWQAQAEGDRIWANHSRLESSRQFQPRRLTDDGVMSSAETDSSRVARSRAVPGGSPTQDKSEEWSDETAVHDVKNPSVTDSEWHDIKGEEQQYKPSGRFSIERDVRGNGNEVQGEDRSLLPPEQPAADDLPICAEILTEFGGVFFLLNVALYLNLYSDFTAPLGPNLDLSIWDLLAVLGSAFTQDKIRHDELWFLLAKLAGHPGGHEPGENFKPPDEWRIPEEWLVPFEPIPNLEQEERDGRLVLLHPEGFTIEDKSCDTLREPGSGDSLRRWLGWMTGYIRARLVRACGRKDAAELVCGCPARVKFTLTHVDVNFALQSHPIEIRLAGLDRDPGWIPAAGRYVMFSFE